MTLVDFTNRVTMSFSDVNVELGDFANANDTIDIQGAATSFSGISTTELTEGLGASAIELKEFFSKEFVTGGQVGTRNPHTIHWLTDADAGGSGGLRAYASFELVYAAELIAAPPAGTAPVTTQNATKYPDDYIDNDLRVDDIVFNNSTGLTKFPTDVNLFGLRGVIEEWWFADSTANKVYRISDTNNGQVLESISRTPGTPTNIEEVSKDDSSIEIRITGPTEVARTLRIYKSEDGAPYTSITKTGTGAGGSDFTSGGSGHNSISITHEFTGLNDDTPYTFYGRFENAFANGADGSTLTITTDADPYFITATPSTFEGDGIGNIEVFTSDVEVGGPDNPWIYLSGGSTAYNRFRVAVSTDGGSTYGSYGSWRTPSANGSYASSKMLAGATDTHFRIQFEIDNEHEDANFFAFYTIYNRETNAGFFQRSIIVRIEEVIQ